MSQKDPEEWREDLPDLRLAIQKSEVNLLGHKADVNLMKDFKIEEFKKQKWQAYAKKASH